MEQEKKSFSSLTKIVTVSMLSAAAFVLYIFEIPFISFGFLKYDLSDIIALTGSIFLGPVAGIVIGLIKNIIHVLVKGLGSTMGFGNVMNFIVGCAFTVPYTLIFKHLQKKSSGKMKTAVISGIISLMSILVLGVIANYFITPLYFRFFLNQEITKEFLRTYLISVTGLNLLKGIVLAVAAYPISFGILDRIRLKNMR